MKQKRFKFFYVVALFLGSASISHLALATEHDKDTPCSSAPAFHTAPDEEGVEFLNTVSRPVSLDQAPGTWAKLRDNLSFACEMAPTKLLDLTKGAIDFFVGRVPILDFVWSTEHDQDTPCSSAPAFPTVPDEWLSRPVSLDQALQNWAIIQNDFSFAHKMAPEKLLTLTEDVLNNLGSKIATYDKYNLSVSKTIPKNGGKRFKYFISIKEKRKVIFRSLLDCYSDALNFLEIILEKVDPNITDTRGAFAKFATTMDQATSILKRDQKLRQSMFNFFLIYLSKWNAGYIRKSIYNIEERLLEADASDKKTKKSLDDERSEKISALKEQEKMISFLSENCELEDVLIQYSEKVILALRKKVEVEKRCEEEKALRAQQQADREAREQENISRALNKRRKDKTPREASLRDGASAAAQRALESQTDQALKIAERESAQREALAEREARAQREALAQQENQRLTREHNAQLWQVALKAMKKAEGFKNWIEEQARSARKAQEHNATETRRRLLENFETLLNRVKNTEAVTALEKLSVEDLEKRIRELKMFHDDVAPEGEALLPNTKRTAGARRDLTDPSRFSKVLKELQKLSDPLPVSERFQHATSHRTVEVDGMSQQTISSIHGANKHQRIYGRTKTMLTLCRSAIDFFEHAREAKLAQTQGSQGAIKTK